MGLLSLETLRKWHVGYTLVKGKNKTKCIIKVTETNNMFDNIVRHPSYSF